MSSWLTGLRLVHRFCVRELVYPIMLSSLLACAVLAGRFYISREWRFDFLAWNLFLAWIPYAASLLMVHMYRRQPGRWARLLLPGFIWLIFLPNAPYLVTDVLHLQEGSSAPLWYDIGMFALFAWTGCLIAVVSLNQMQHLVRAFIGSAASWLFAFGVMGLSGFGIYLGRFLEWNSWDIFVEPRPLLGDILVRFVHPVQYRQTFGVTLLFAAFMLVCYLTFVAIEHRQKYKLENERPSAN